MMNRKMRNTLFLFMAIMGLTGCIRTPEWTLFYYADEAKTPQQAIDAQFIAGYYDTLEQCQAKAKGMLRLSGKNSHQLDANQLENATAIPVAIDKGYQCKQLCQVNDDNVIICQ
ncbi:hypothetical protein [Shewanella sp. UCD-KL21]|uniref:hypothetical protein n=1 Tax=Shewanella sp. UCD-KL21 TaxID=1917164 RepID=UPI0009F9DBE6|nr:hypothetical protein [Shewanella sp. UCD-KL21]